MQRCHVIFSCFESKKNSAKLKEKYLLGWFHAPTLFQQVLAQLQVQKVFTDGAPDRAARSDCTIRTGFIDADWSPKEALANPKPIR